MPNLAEVDDVAVLRRSLTIILMRGRIMRASIL
jgi:hypothetical protein